MKDTERRQLRNAVLACEPEAQALAVQMGPAAISLLRKAMKHPESRVRLTAVHCLVRITGREVVEICAKAILDPEPAVRFRAIRELFEHGDSSHVQGLITALAEWTDEPTRSRVALAIGKLDWSRESVPVLKDLWRSERNSGTKEALMTALARLGDREAQAEFVQGLHGSCRAEIRGARISNAAALRFFDYARYIHEQWLIRPLTVLLTNTAPLIRLRAEHGPLRCARVCDIALSLAASISGVSFSFTANRPEVFTAKERLEARNRLIQNRSRPHPPSVHEVEVIAAEIRQVLRHGNLPSKKIILRALRKAGDPERLSASHLLTSLYALEPAFLLHIFNGTVDVRNLLQFAEKRTPGETGKPAIGILRLARALRPANMPVAVPQLLVALVLDGDNEISEYLRLRNVNVWKLVERQFQQTFFPPFFFGAEESELKARTWLLQLIPEQGCSYMNAGQIEVPSSLFPGRIYKIYCDRDTEIFEDRRRIADARIYFEDPSLPETDRVLAEYFLIRGNEQRYLRTANVFRCS